MALTIAEARSDLGVSQRELARLSGVSATTVRKLERGRGHVDPALVIRLASTLTVLELHEPTTTLAQPARPLLVHGGGEAA
jgi:transcriptional regulator with XRE-family HTH domain